jgi:hypothetical protein
VETVRRIEVKSMVSKGELVEHNKNIENMQLLDYSASGGILEKVPHEKDLDLDSAMVRNQQENVLQVLQPTKKFAPT